MASITTGPPLPEPMDRADIRESPIIDEGSMVPTMVGPYLGDTPILSHLIQLDMRISHLPLLTHDGQDIVGRTGRS